MDERTIKGLLGGIVIGAIAATGLTIGTGLAVMKSEAQKQADQAGQEALVNGYSDICLTRFDADPRREFHLGELKKLQVYEQRDYLERQSFAVMEGSDKPYRDTNDRCLVKITEKYLK